MVIGGNCGNGGGGIAATATKGRRQQCREYAILINAKLLSPLWFVARFCSLPARQLKILSLSLSFSPLFSVIYCPWQKKEKESVLWTHAQQPTKKSLLFSSAPLCTLMWVLPLSGKKEEKEEEKEKRKAANVGDMLVRQYWLPLPLPVYLGDFTHCHTRAHCGSIDNSGISQIDNTGTPLLLFTPFWCRRHRLLGCCFKFLALCFSCLDVVIRSLQSFYPHYHPIIYSFIHSFAHHHRHHQKHCWSSNHRPRVVSQPVQLSAQFWWVITNLSNTTTSTVSQEGLFAPGTYQSSCPKAESSYKRVQQPPTAPVRAGA